MKSVYAILLLTLAFCWGPSFFFIKIALDGFSPLMIVNIRLFIGFILLLSLILIQKHPLLKYLSYWRDFLVMGILACAVPWTFLSYAEQKLSSAVAGMINGSVPMITMVLSHYLLDHEKISKEKMIGLFIGLGGIFCIFVPPLFHGFTSSSIGIIYLSLSSFSSALGMVYARKHLKDLPNLISPMYQLFFAFLVVFPFMLTSTNFSKLTVPNLASILSLLMLGLVGTGIAFIIFYYLIKNVGATYTSTTSLLIPLVAIFFGVVFLQEKLYWISYVGCGLIIISLIMTNSFISLKSLFQIFKSTDD